MADWTTLPNLAVGVGGLPSGTTVTALRDNPIAIAEGATGAPRVTGEGIATVREYAISNGPLVNGVSGDLSNAATYFEGSFFDVFMEDDPETQSCGVVVNAAAAGTLRFQCRQINTGSSSSNSTLQFWKNGSLVEEWTRVGNSNTLRIVDAAVAVDDTFEWVLIRNTDNGQVAAEPQDPVGNNPLIQVPNWIAKDRTRP